MKIRSHFIKPYQNCTVFTVSLEKSGLAPIFPGNTRHGIRRLLHPAHHVEGAHEKLIKSQAHLSS